MGSSRIGCDVVHEERWLRFQMITYKDPDGNTRKWEAVERTSRQGDIDAVEIFPILRTPGAPDSTLLITQYRPALDRTTLELPAGLIDKGETPMQAALRELKEETGYVGEMESALVTPVMFNDPGITNANTQMIVINVDMSREENQNPVPASDLGEFIETQVVPINGLYARLKDLEEKNGFALDARLVSLAVGLEFAANVKTT